MSTELAVSRHALNGAAPALPVQADGVHAIENAMAELKAVRTFVKHELQPGLDFGTIPGCGAKPTLFLPGAQKAAMYFNAYPDPVVERTEHGNGHVEISVTCRLVNRSTGLPIGCGVGSCSSLESKYRYRNAERTCPACGKATIIKGKAEYGGGWLCFKKKDGCGAKFRDGDPAIEGQEAGQAENPNPHDVRNTVLKMAKKRAMVDAALSLGCLSEMFTQDIEDTYTAADLEAAAAPADPHPAPDRRREVNETFAPAPQARKDDRPIDVLIRDGLARARETFADAFPGVEPGLPNEFEAERHLLKDAAALAGEDVPPGLSQGDVRRELARHYGGPHRKALRRALADYLQTKLTEASETAANGDGADDPDDDYPDETPREREPGED